MGDITLMFSFLPPLSVGVSSAKRKKKEFFSSQLLIEQIRAREIDKCQNANRSVSTEMISYFRRTYGNSRLDVYIRKYVTFEFWTNLDKGHRREFWCIYLYIAASLFLKCLFSFFDVLSMERKILRNFRQQTRVNFDRPTRVV